MKKIFTTAFFLLMLTSIVSAKTPILGTNEATVERMYQFVKSQNADFDREIAEQFYEVSEIYGIRGDIALCQSIIETGWFKFDDGTAMRPEHHNYCGLGVTSLGIVGDTFETIHDGVTAQMQHLYAYACTASLPAGETLIDSRFQWVSPRGKAPNWEDLSGQWSTASNYGTQIIAKYEEMMAFTMPEVSLSASISSFNLSGVAGTAENIPSKKFVITGTGLSSEIVYNSSSGAFTISVGEDWDSYEGGTMIATLNTNMSPGDYSGYIAVQSGSGDNLKRVEIQCAATILDPSAVPPALSFTEGWNASEIAGTATYYGWDATKIRNMCYGDEKLYCVYDKSEIKMIDARTGADLGNLNKTAEVAGGIYTLCDVKYLDGSIIACNLALAAKEFRVYLWENDEATPVLIYNETATDRIGDRMGVAGSIDGTLRLTFGNAGGNITELTRTNGVWSKKTISTGITTGTATHVIPVEGGYYIDGRSILPTFLNTEGVKQYTLANESVKDGNDFGTFEYDGKNYMMVATYLNKTNSLAEGAMRLFDVTSGWDNSTAIKYYPESGLGTTRNTSSVTSSIALNTGTNYAEAWILTDVQGLAYYKSGYVPSSDTPPVIADPELNASIDQLTFSTSENTTTTKTLHVSGTALTEDITLAITGTDAGLFTLSTDKISRVAASADVIVTYAPTATGDHSALLTISSGNATPIEISLSGTATKNIVVKGQKLTLDWKVTEGLPTASDARWAAGHDGKLYLQDNVNAKVIVLDGTSSTDIATGIGGWCLTADEAGNLIISAGKYSTGSIDFRILPAGKTSADDLITISVTSPTSVANGRMDTFGRAIGDVMSEKGGAFFTLGQKQPAITKVFVANGAVVADKVTKIETGVDNLSANNLSVVQPINNDIEATDNVVWMSRTVENSLMNLDGTSFKDYTTNTTAGGDIITLSNVTYTIEPSGTNSSDGFIIVDRTNDKLIYTNEETGTSTVQQSYVAFEKIDETTANVYHYTPGIVAAKYTFKLDASVGVEDITATHGNADIRLSGNILIVSGITPATINMYSIDGSLAATVKDSNELNTENLSGIYVVAITDNSGMIHTGKVIIK